MDLQIFHQPRYHDTLYSALLTTPLGTMLAVYSARGLCLLEFLDRKNIERTIRLVQRAKHANLAYHQNLFYFNDLQRYLDEYFSHQRTHFHDITLDWVGTPFQQKAWQILQSIPYGQTMSYAQQALAVGNSKAVRAVAAANSQNVISIVIPCHRVIGRNGHLTGYAGGLARKQALLWHEQGNRLNENAI